MDMYAQNTSTLWQPKHFFWVQTWNNDQKEIFTIDIDAYVSPKNMESEFGVEIATM